MSGGLKTALALIKAKLFLQYRKEYDQEWMRVTGYKVGDHVKAIFGINYGNRKESYSGTNECEAILILDESGCLAAESTKEMQYSRTENNGRPPWRKSFRSWWVYDKKILHVGVDDVVIPDKEAGK